MSVPHKVWTGDLIHAGFNRTSIAEVAATFIDHGEWTSAKQDRAKAARKAKRKAVAGVARGQWPMSAAPAMATTERINDWAMTLNKATREAAEAETEIDRAEQRVQRASAERDTVVKTKLKRFRRNRDLPEDLENLRCNLIAARVLSGMSPGEAADRFVFKESGDRCEKIGRLDLIEDGKCPVPTGHAWLRQIADFYGVSCDFLLGLSPHADVDSKLQQQHAFSRLTARLMSGVAKTFAGVAAELEKDTRLSQEDFASLESAIGHVDSAVTVLRKHGLEDMRGSASLLGAMDALSVSAEPLRKASKTFRGLARYLADVEAGRMPVIPYLLEKYDRMSMIKELLGDDNAHA